MNKPNKNTAEIKKTIHKIKQKEITQKIQSVGSVWWGQCLRVDGSMLVHVCL